MSARALIICLSVLLLACKSKPPQNDAYGIERLVRPKMHLDEAAGPVEGEENATVFDSVAIPVETEPLRERPRQKHSTLPPPPTVTPPSSRRAEPPASAPAAPQQHRGKPQTREEARARAFGLYTAARRALDKGAVDTALQHVDSAIALYENGALFALKARALLQTGEYAGARVAAERSQMRTDHWQPESRETARAARIAAMERMYQQSPSTILRKEIEHAIRSY